MHFAIRFLSVLLTSAGYLSSNALCHRTIKVGSVVCAADPIIGAKWGSQFTVDANSNLVKCQRCGSYDC